MFLFFQEHVFGKLLAYSDDIFETPDLVASCKDEDVLPDWKLVYRSKSNTLLFILTSDEAYRDKLEAKKTKEEKEKKKRANIKYIYSDFWKIFYFNYENGSTSYWPKGWLGWAVIYLILAGRFFILLKYFRFLCSSCVEYSLEPPSHF